MEDLSVYIDAWLVITDNRHRGISRSLLGNCILLCDVLLTMSNVSVNVSNVSVNVSKYFFSIMEHSQKSHTPLPPEIANGPMHYLTVFVQTLVMWPITLSIKHMFFSADFTCSREGKSKAINGTTPENKLAMEYKSYSKSRYFFVD